MRFSPTRKSLFQLFCAFCILKECFEITRVFLSILSLRRHRRHGFVDPTQKPTMNCSHSGYSSPKANARFDERRGAFGMVRRIEIIKEMKQLIADESAAIRFCCPLMSFVNTSTVVGRTSDHCRASAATGFAARSDRPTLQDTSITLAPFEKEAVTCRRQKASFVRGHTYFGFPGASDKKDLKIVPE